MNSNDKLDGIEKKRGRRLNLGKDKTAVPGKEMTASPLSQGWAEKVYGLFAPKYPASRSYRHLARRIDADLPRNDGGVSILFTSPDSMKLTGETMLMFAYFMQDELGASVLLVDASLRSDGLGSELNCADKHGFMDLIEDDGYQIDKLIQPTRHANVSVLPGGKPEEDGIGIVNLKPEKIRKFIDAACQRFDFVLIHQGSVLADTRYILVAEQVNFVLLLADEGHTFIDDLDTCIKKFKDHQINNIRMVLISN